MSEKEEDKSKDTGTPSVESFAKLLETNLKASIKSGVESANNVLGSLEEQAEKYGRPVVSSLHKIEHEGEIVAHKVSSFYDKRKQYGPEIIGGSALVVGSIVGLRRGKIPALATATATGFLAYLGVYEIDLRRFPDIVFGKEDTS